MKNLTELRYAAAEAQSNYEDAKRLAEAIELLEKAADTSPGYLDGYAGSPEADALEIVLLALHPDGNYGVAVRRVAVEDAIDRDREAVREILDASGC